MKGKPRSKVSPCIDNPPLLRYTTYVDDFLVAYDWIIRLFSRLCQVIKDFSSVFRNLSAKHLLVGI